MSQKTKFNKEKLSSASTTKDQLKTSKGFTLIEILIVVGIIGLLASVILVGLNSSRSRARDARRISDLRQTQQGLELYYTKNQEYPPSGSWTNLSSELTTSNIGIRKVATDPLNGSGGHSEYEYGASSNGQDYILKASLEDDGATLVKDSIIGVTIGGVNCAGSEQAFCVTP